MDSSLYVVNTGSELYGPFNTVDEAEKWGKENDEELGDWYIQDLYLPMS
jgi:hypothetical protein